MSAAKKSAVEQLDAAMAAIDLAVGLLSDHAEFMTRFERESACGPHAGDLFDPAFFPERERRLYQQIIGPQFRAALQFIRESTFHRERVERAFATISKSEKEI